MKFEFDDVVVNSGAVAYTAKDHEGDNVLVLKYYINRGLAIYEDGSIDTQYVWDELNATRKFYKGDKITITF